MLGLGANIAMSDRLFSLNDISDLSLYLKNGVGVSLAQWDDSSGNANHATQATSGDQGELLEGGLHFEKDEGDHYDLGTEITISAQQGFTLFFVAEIEAIAQNATILSKASTIHFFEMMSGGDNIRLRLGSTNTVVGPDTQNLWGNAAGKFLMTLVREAGSTGNIILYNKGVLLSQATAGQAANTGDAEYSIIGARGGDGSEDRFIDGTIYELAFYEKQLSAYELADVHSYLIDKHGL